MYFQLLLLLGSKQDRPDSKQARRTRLDVPEKCSRTLLTRARKNLADKMVSDGRSTPYFFFMTTKILGISRNLRVMMT